MVNKTSSSKTNLCIFTDVTAVDITYVLRQYAAGCDVNAALKPHTGVEKTAFEPTVVLHYAAVPHVSTAYINVVACNAHHSIRAEHGVSENDVERCCGHVRSVVLITDLNILADDGVRDARVLADTAVLANHDVLLQNTTTAQTQHSLCRIQHSIT